MTSLRRRFRSAIDAESGLSLVEVVIAMFIFLVITLGVAASLVSTLHAAIDAKKRQVAINLASQSIDAARSVSDIFQLGTGVTTTATTVPGDTTVYTVSSKVQWVTSSGSDANCGSGGGALQYKEVNVSVTWPGINVAFPVRSDTILAPSSAVNDPALGTILVRVTNAAGAGVAGVTISTSPSTGTAIPVTDADGCSYLIKIPPATYKVTASLGGYIDINQAASPVSSDQPVTAGSALSVPFTYDKQGTVTANYASLSANIPKDLDTTFTSTIGGSDYFASTTAAASKTFSLYPALYTALAGAYVPSTPASSGCRSVDPAQWPVGTNSGGQRIASPAPATVSSLSGTPATVAIPMGLVILKPSGSTVYISATAATPPTGSGDPGCGTTLPLASPAETYNFGPINVVGSQVLIALPYGSWSLKTGPAANSLSPFTTVSNILVPPGVTGTSVSTAGIVTLDPRVVTP